MPNFPARPVGLLDVAARCAASLVPQAWIPRVDQARFDLRAVIDGIQGYHEVPFRDALHAPRPLAPLESIHPVEHLLPRPLATRYSALRRDLSMVVDGVAGRHPPPFARRTPPTPRFRWDARASLPVPVPARAVHVVRVERPSRDAVTLHLADDTGARFDFAAGQFVTLLVEIGGRTHRRAYSICTSPSQAEGFALTVKRVEGGLVSSFLHEHAAAGMRLRVLGPSGSFVWTSDLAGDLILIAAGSGITPIMSILRAALGSSNRRIALLYGNKTQDDTIFGQELDELAATHADRLVVRHVLSRADERWAGLRGRIGESSLGAFLDEVPWGGEPGTCFYVCGPEGMMSAVGEALARRAVDASRIRRERFASPHGAPTDTPVTWTIQPMTVRSNGVDRTVMVRAGQTLLEAGLEAGLPFKFSCMMGGCAACKVHVRSGAVHMGEPNALTSSERDAGHALACIARPLEPVKVELG